MPPPSKFERFNDGDVAALIAEYPLAWVCTRGGRADEASLLPLIGDYDPAGRLVGLIGHLARSNPLFAALRNDPAALILFQGPQAYVSPEHVGVRDWAPTWNFAQLRIEAAVTFDEGATDAALDILIRATEAGRPKPWHTVEMGVRYETLRGAIIGFRADVLGVAGKFKLGQDERPEIRDAIMANHPDAAMVRWMGWFDAKRQREGHASDG